MKLQKKSTIKKLDWDSKFFGFNIAHLNLRDDIFGKEVMYYIDHFVKENEIRLIQTLCNISNLDGINYLEKSGFQYADTRIDFFTELNKYQFPNREFLLANEEDINDLKLIADSLFINSRYYYHLFNPVRVNELFKIWVEKSVKGLLDDYCIKVKRENKIAGFVTVKITDANTARIGLIGVAKEYSSKGVGKELLFSLFSFLSDKNTSVIYVATQGKNLLAQNFYISNKFLIDSINVWYYKDIDKS